MSCDVYLYDDAMVPVNNNMIDIVETDHWGVKHDIQTSQALGANQYGALLVLPNPPQPICIWIHDSSEHYAPTSIGFLNASLTIRLDVALYPLPVGPGVRRGSGPINTLRGVRTYVADSIEAEEWTDAEGRAVTCLVETAISAANMQSKGEELQAMFDEWLFILTSLGIEIAFSEMNKRLTAIDTTRSRGGTNQPLQGGMTAGAT